MRASDIAEMFVKGFNGETDCFIELKTIGYKTWASKKTAASTLSLSMAKTLSVCSTRRNARSKKLFNGGNGCWRDDRT